MAVTKAEFERYKEVQKSGVVNMLSSQVQDLANISRDTHMEIIQTYDKLAEQYGGIEE